MSRVVLVSNRVLDPTKASRAGGVPVVLANIARAREVLWFGWSGELKPAGEMDVVMVQDVQHSSDDDHLVFPRTQRDYGVSRRKAARVSELEVWMRILDAEPPGEAMQAPPTLMSLLTARGTDVVAAGPSLRLRRSEHERTLGLPRFRGEVTLWVQAI